MNECALRYLPLPLQNSSCRTKKQLGRLADTVGGGSSRHFHNILTSFAGAIVGQLGQCEGRGRLVKARKLA